MKSLNFLDPGLVPDPEVGLEVTDPDLQFAKGPEAIPGIGEIHPGQSVLMQKF